MIKKYLYLATLVIGLAFIVSFSTTAFGEEFYKGKTIRFVVGGSVGGGYDTYTRIIARYIGKYIPGNPTPIVQNMTGRAHLVSALYIYRKAKPDGLTVGVWNSAYVLRQALGDRRVKLKADKFGWIGAPVKGLPFCGVMGFTGLKTLKDVLNSKKPLKMGSTGSGTPNDLPNILNLTLSTKFEVIDYGRSSRIRLAMQKRELDGFCFGWESARATVRPMLDAKGDDKLIPFITHGNSQDPEVRDLPRLTEVAKGEENRAVLNTWLAQYEFPRALSLPPGTPKERLSILRKAFKSTLEDRQFLAQTKKSKLIINYVSGEEIEKFVNQILAISPAVKERLLFLVTKRKKGIK